MVEHDLLLADSFHAGFVLLVVAIIGVAIFFRLMAGSLDKERIEQYLRSRGYEPLEITWEPFGRGFWGEKNDRIYFVRYRDAEGNLCRAWCKTNLWGGVYLSDDDPPPSKRSRHSSPKFSAETLLQKENQKLREEIERLKRQNEEGQAR